MREEFVFHSILRRLPLSVWVRLGASDKMLAFPRHRRQIDIENEIRLNENETISTNKKTENFRHLSLRCFVWLLLLASEPFILFALGNSLRLLSVVSFDSSSAKTIYVIYGRRSTIYTGLQRHIDTDNNGNAIPVRTLELEIMLNGEKYTSITTNKMFRTCAKNEMALNAERSNKTADEESVPSVRRSCPKMNKYISTVFDIQSTAIANK